MSIEQRQEQLQQDLIKLQQMLADGQKQMDIWRDTRLRIEGALQVLAELSQEQPAERPPDPA